MSWISTVTLEQLKVFVAIAELAHMTRAAERLHMTQSAASAAIASLEARHGVRLFERVGRGLTLSDAGRAFLPEARAVLASAAAAAQALDDVTGLRRGQIALYASQTVGSYWLPPRLVGFRQAHPGIGMSLRVGNSAQAMQAVLDGEVDLGFIEDDLAAPKLDQIVIGSDRLVLAVRAGHPWAVLDEIGCERLRRATWVLREPGSGTRHVFEAALLRQGVDPAQLDVALELPSNEAVLAAVVAGDCLCAVSESAAAPLLAAGLIRILAFQGPERAFTLVRQTARSVSRATGALIDWICAVQPHL